MAAPSLVENWRRDLRCDGESLARRRKLRGQVRARFAVAGVALAAPLSRELDASVDRGVAFEREVVVADADSPEAIAAVQAESCGAKENKAARDIVLGNWGGAAGGGASGPP